MVGKPADTAGDLKPDQILPLATEN
jgi:hypothetical protein